MLSTGVSVPSIGESQPSTIGPCRSAFLNVTIGVCQFVVRSISNLMHTYLAHDCANLTFLLSSKHHEGYKTIHLLSSCGRVLVNVVGVEE